MLVGAIGGNTLVKTVKNILTLTVDSVAKATGLDRAIVATLSGTDEESLTEQAEAIAAIAKPQGGAPLAPEAGQKQKPGKPSKKDILGIEDKKERMAAIAANIDLFK